MVANKQEPKIGVLLATRGLGMRAQRENKSIDVSSFFNMAEKAEEIGMVNTNFNNSSGINDPNNYSTVRDILKMSKYFIDNYPEF